MTPLTKRVPCPHARTNPGPPTWSPHHAPTVPQASIPNRPTRAERRCTINAAVKIRFPSDFLAHVKAAAAAEGRDFSNYVRYRCGEAAFNLAPPVKPRRRGLKKRPRKHAK